MITAWHVFDVWFGVICGIVLTMLGSLFVRRTPKAQPPHDPNQVQVFMTEPPD